MPATTVAVTVTSPLLYTFANIYDAFTLDKKAK